MRKYALFGYGSGLDLFFGLRAHDISKEIVAVFDNNYLQLPPDINGIRIDDPSNIDLYDFDKILITSRHYIEIYNQLKLLDIEEAKIQIFLPLINF